MEPVPTETVSLNNGAEMPTFAQALQSAVSAFSTQLGALNTVRFGVLEAVDSKAAARTQLESAQMVEEEAVASEAQVSESAMAARDEVVAILQSWNP